MSDRNRQSGSHKQQHRPETEPYAPPKHPDVHVPEQQLEQEDLEKARKTGKDKKNRH